MPHHETQSIWTRALPSSVLNPIPTFSDDINQNSIVLRVTYGSVSFLFMDDANADAESGSANSGTNLKADILKVGYHGSVTSSSSVFLSEVPSKVNVIEVGAGNSYGPPTSSDTYVPGPGLGLLYIAPT